MVKLLYALLLVIFLVTLQSCLVGRFVRYNFSGITDYKIFPSRPLPKAEVPFRFVEKPQKKRIGNIRVATLDSLIAANNTVAFLIIQNDTLLFEHYYQHYEASSTVASFSMAKSYTSALIGIALADGSIKSVDEPITNYITELKDKTGFDRIKIKHVLQMTSGIHSNESYYNPLGQAARLYYGRSLRNYINHLKIEYDPGTRFAYRSMNTQLLGLILERATGKSVTEYMNSNIWNHLGAEYDASWSIDKKKDGLEKTFCCINAKARDFAKFGRLYLQKGNWNGDQLILKSWVLESTTATREEGGTAYYKYQWWLTKHGFYADGLHGQYIFVNPKKKMIIVRLGKSEGSISWPSLFNTIVESI